MKNRDLNAKLAGWTVPPAPSNLSFDGRYARLEPLSVSEQSATIHAANCVDDSVWDYMFDGPYADLESYQNWMAGIEHSQDPVFLAIFDKERQQWGGVASYMRIKPEIGVIEVGSINFSKSLQRTRAATESIYLMMKWVFQAGYRRFEWKCNALNIPSCRAAERFGFSYEGIFRQAMVVKGRNRDTAWFAIIDSDWPTLERAFQAWLSPDNFDENGQQKTSLRKFTAPAIVSKDPRLAD